MGESAGYPLWTMMTHAAVRWMPFGSPAYRTNACAALCAALCNAVMLLVRLFRPPLRSCSPMPPVPPVVPPYTQRALPLTSHRHLSLTPPAFHRSVKRAATCMRDEISTTVCRYLPSSC